MGFVISDFLFLAYDPHNMNTTGVSFSFIFFMTLSVNCSHPWSLCDVGLCSSTVNTAFNNSTPSLAHGFNELSWGNGICKSLSSSLKMFFNDGGLITVLLTEKAKPSAWFIPWYGSCPSITTLTSS